MTDAGRALLDVKRLEDPVDPRLPWGGRSPRCLTAAYKRFRLEPLGDDVGELFDDVVVEEQYRRFLQDFPEGR